CGSTRPGGRSVACGAHLARGQTVGGLENPAEVGGVHESPAGTDRSDRLLAQARVLQVGAAAFPAPCADPGGDGGALFAEDAVQVPGGDEVCGGDLLRSQVHVAQVRLNVVADLLDQRQVRVAAAGQVEFIGQHGGDQVDGGAGELAAGL